LSREDRFKIWLHYFITNTSLRYRAHFGDVINDPIDYGWGPYDKKVGNLEVRYLWKKLKPIDFEDFDDERACDWYYKFKKEIDIKWEEK